jgi:hypothetical protein
MGKKPIKHKREVDLSQHNAEHLQDRFKDPNMIGVNTSADCPLYVRQFRLMEDGEKHDPSNLRWDSHLIGWTLEVNAFTLSTKVFVRIGRDPASVRVFVQEDDGKPTKIYEAEFE